MRQNDPCVLSEIIWELHCLKDASGWPKPCAQREEGRGMLGVTLGGPSMAQTPAEGLWWRSGDGEWIDRIIEAGIAFEKGE